MRKRKLLTQKTLTAIYKDVDRGVPLARAMRNNNVRMSRPAVHKLVQAFKAARHTDTVHNSLFPEWLTVDEQEQPSGYAYDGYFPYGEWRVSE